MVQDLETPLWQKSAQEFVGKAILAPSHRSLPTNASINSVLSYGKHIRDSLVWQEGIMAGAVQVYQQLASSREWVVSGKPRPAARAVDFLNETRSVDMNTGYVVEGFEEFLRRRALDYICVGRIAFLNRTISGDKTVLEYADPTSLLFTRQRPRIQIVQDDEKIWSYFGVSFRHDEVFLGHSLPIGSQGYFVAPITPVVPSLMLQYLIREHDTAALDGRKVRDIIIVANDQMKNTMISAIQTQVAMWSGVQVPSEVGVPVVAVNQPSGTKMEDMITRISLSNLPEEFDREVFTFEYVNQIASALGLSLRHFWNNEKTTNRALEEIQEQRQQRKGPSEYVNTEQHIINRSKILNRFGGKTRFGFIEEVDSQSQLDKADVLKKSVEALSIVQQVFQAQLSLPAMLAWMQTLRVLPNELELISAGTPQNTALINPSDTGQTVGETTTEGTPSPTALPDNRDKAERGRPIPRYDEVTINGKGEIVERRVRVFSAANYLAEVMEAEEDESSTDVKMDEPQEGLETFEEVIRQEQEKIRTLFLATYEPSLLTGLFDSVYLYDLDTVQDTITRATSSSDLSGQDYAILTILLEHMGSSVKDQPEGGFENDAT